MSLLLDALKQAAQEKKLRDALLANSLVEGDLKDDQEDPIVDEGSDLGDIKTDVSSKLDLVTEDNENHHQASSEIKPAQDNNKLDTNVKEDNLHISGDNNLANQSQPSAEGFVEEIDKKFDKGFDKDKEHSVELNLDGLDDDLGVFELADDLMSDARDDLLEGFVVRSGLSPEAKGEPKEKPKEEKVLTLEEISTSDESQAKESPASDIVPEPNTVEDESKHKDAIKQLIVLRKAAVRKRIIKATLVLFSALAVSGLSLFVYFTMTVDRLQLSLAVSDSFDQYVTELASLEAVAEAEALNNSLVNEPQLAFSTKAVVTPSPEPLAEAVDAADNNITVSDIVQAVVKDTSEPDVIPTNVVSDKVSDLDDKDSKLSTDESIDNKNINPKSIKEKIVNTGSKSSISKAPVTKAPASKSAVTKAAVKNDSIKQGRDKSTAYVRPGNKVVDKNAQLIQQAYNAYQKGQLGVARNLYDQSLALTPDKRDAILGAAAVAMRQGRQQDALLLYQRLLSISPQDSYGRAGLLSLQAANIKDPRWLSQVNQLLLRYPDDAHLHFLKANAYAVNGRWQAAQQSYFDAWSRDNVNPDYAYNLAIALDQLGQADAALDYYRKASDLTNIYPSNIVMKDLQKRISQLLGGQGGR